MEFKTFFHGHSYTGNPLGCAAAIANLEVFENERTLDKIQPKISLLERLITPLKYHPHVGDVRQKGLMAGIELVKNSGKKSPYLPENKIGIKVCMEARKMGIMLRPIGNVIILMPPLSISQTDLKKMVSLIIKSINNITFGGHLT